MKKFLMLIVIVVIAAIFSIIAGKVSYSLQSKNDAEELFAEADFTNIKKITEEDLQRVPPVVRNYLRTANVVGKRQIRTVRIEQTGSMKLKQGAGWMPLSAEQYFTSQPPGFIWLANIETIPFFFMTARDSYIDGAGRMLIKLMAIVRTADKIGYKMNEASLMRYIAEMVWFPTAFLNRGVSWSQLDSRTAKCTMRKNDVKAQVVFHFNDNNEIELIEASRYRMEGKTLKRRKWQGKILQYRDYKGIKIPSKIEAAWVIRKKEFPYIRLKIEQIDYNVTEPF